MRIFLPIVALGFVGCLAGGGDTTDDQVDNDTGKQDSSYPSGVFNSTEDAGHDGTIGTLTLSTDHTFSRTLKVAACPTIDAGCATTTGTYKFSHSTTSANRYIRFLDAHGTLVDRYTYELDGETLELHVDTAETWTTLANADQTQLDAQDQACEDDKGNSLGECPDDFFCQNYVDGNYQCLPPT